MKKLGLTLGLLLLSLVMFGQTYEFKGILFNGFKAPTKMKGSLTFTDTTVVIHYDTKYMVPVTTVIKERVGDKIKVFSRENESNYYVIGKDVITLHNLSETEGGSFEQTITYKLKK